MVVTPLGNILGEDAEKICKLDMSKAQEYLENEKDKETYKAAMGSLL